VNVRERARGYWAALAEAGIPEEEVPVQAVRLDAENVGAALELLFKGDAPAPTALLSMSDRVALRALNWLSSQGIGVPTEVSVVGFDGAPEAETAKPPLTTVEQPFRAIAERGVAALLDGEMPVGGEVLPVLLRIRESTAPARGSGQGQ
jgi:DNA-binding LacI/PurR family transcriptional regulator